MLGFCYVVGLATRRIPVQYVAVAMAAVALLLSTQVENFAFAGLFLRYAWYGSFFFLGATSHMWAATWQRQRGLVPAVLLLAAIAWAVVSVADPEARWSRGLPAFTASIAGILALLWVAPRIQWPEWLRRVGMNSIVWYVAHLPIICAGALLLLDLGVTSWVVQLPLLLLAALLLPWALTPLARTPLFRWSRDVPPILTGRNV